MYKNKYKTYTPSSAKILQSFSKIPARTNLLNKNNPHEKQIQSRITHNHMKQGGQTDINRLDLIFKSEPKEIQQKLMKLLISYNAVMQYNHQSDMFEVDLLLPFLNQQQKQEFIKQFLQIRRQRKNKTPQKLDSTPSQPKQNRQFQNQQSNFPKSNSRKFSFGKKQTDDYYNSNQTVQEEAINQFKNYKQVDDDLKQDNKGLNNSKGQLEQRSQNLYIKNNKSINPLNLMQISKMFDQRLTNAVHIINRRKGLQSINKQNLNIGQIQRPIKYDQEQSQDKQRQSIIDQMSIATSLSNTQNLSDSKNVESSSSNHESVQQDLQSFHKRNEPLKISGHKRFDEVIQEKEQYEQYEPLFGNSISYNHAHAKNWQASKNKNITTFEDYSKKYTSVQADKQKNKKKINYPKTFIKKNQNDIHPIKNIILSTKIQRRSPYKNKSNERRVESQESYNSAHKNQNSSSKEHSRRQRNISDFFNEHKLHLQSLYSQIRGQIKQRIKDVRPTSYFNTSSEQKISVSPSRSLEDLNILIMDDQQQQEIVGSQQVSQGITNKQFKQQMIKQYKKQVLVDNQRLSSQDLTKYFKYLLANAKKLFLRYLKNKRK